MPAGRPNEYNKMIIETKKISELKPAPYNPRQSTAKQEEKLKASLSKFGLVEPIIYNKQTGYIVGGHFRVRELTKLGYEEIECVIVDLNEADEKELNIRLNANTGQWDWEMLANEWNSDELTEWGLDVPNFAPDVEEQGDLSDNIKQMFRIEVVCKDEEHQELVYNQLIEKGYECRLLTL